MSEDCVLLVDEIYLQKSVQFHSGSFIGRSEERTLYKGIVVFMIVSLKKSIPLEIKSSPDITITGEWLKSEIDECLYNLQKAGFYVRTVISDDHASNVRAFKLLLKNYNGDKNLFIYHPAYNETLKTYLFFDIVHLVKNIRNNLLNRKKFVFPEFSFGEFRDLIEIPNGFISWKTFYDVYEKDSELQANLRKAPKLTYGAIHPSNNKQSMPLALAIFDGSATATIECYFPEKSDAACFLSALQKLFVLCNAKTQYNTSNMLGNAVVCNDSKPDFLLSFATWVEQWSTCLNFSLAKKTSHTLTTTVKATSCLLSELPNEGYKYVLIARFQSDPLERQFSKYKQMRGGRFLVSLREVINPEKNFKVVLLKKTLIFGKRTLL